MSDKDHGKNENSSNENRPSKDHSHVSGQDEATEEATKRWKRRAVKYGHLSESHGHHDPKKRKREDRTR